MSNENDRYSSFVGYKHIADGNLNSVLRAAKEYCDSVNPDSAGLNHHPENLLIFRHEDGRQVDFDLSGIPETALPGEEPARKVGKGRPRLGVISKEVTLLPRNWEWLSRQSTTASATLRRLVNEAENREKNSPKARAQGLGAILWSLAGNLEGFEEASRCLYRLDFEGLFGFSDKWPGDLPGYVRNWFRDAQQASVKAPAGGSA